jgi:hypothetical protein
LQRRLIFFARRYESSQPGFIIGSSYSEGEGLAMSDELKGHVLEIVSIATECPDHLQALCFELLLRDYLEGRRRPVPAEVKQQESEQPPPVRELPVVPDLATNETNTGQQDLKAGDLHVKARKFLEKYSISLDHLNQLFYKENGTIKPLYEDLKTTRMAESQIRAALLQALLSGVTSGEFVAEGEAVRAEVQQRKAYDATNFAKNFRTSANLFEGFESYDKGTPLRLSEDGRKELAELIKELAR